MQVEEELKFGFKTCRKSLKKRFDGENSWQVTSAHFWMIEFELAITERASGSLARRRWFQVSLT
jgi:hypothetical protein